MTRTVRKSNFAIQSMDCWCEVSRFAWRLLGGNRRNSHRQRPRQCSERVSRDFRPYYRYDGFAVKDRQVGAAGCFGDFPSRDFASFGKKCAGRRSCPTDKTYLAQIVTARAGNPSSGCGEKGQRSVLCAQDRRRTSAKDRRCAWIFDRLHPADWCSRGLVGRRHRRDAPTPDIIWHGFAKVERVW